MIVKQWCTIEDWHPTTNPNQRTSHWSVGRKRHYVDAQTAWATAKQAGWVFIAGKVRLTVTLVYKKKPLPDHDNAVARCKGIVDGLRNHPSPWIKPRPGYPMLSGLLGFFEDDSPEWLELEVRAVVEPGVKATRLELEPA